MVEGIDESLAKITKGAGIILIGTALGMLLAFIGKVLLVRYVTPSEYGIFSLGLVFFNIIVAVSRLGLYQGTPRYIAYYRGKKDEGKVREVAYASIIISLSASVLLALCLCLTSNLISTNFIHDQALATPLKIFTIAIPFFALINIFSLIFQGFEKARPNVYFNLLQNALFLALLGLVIALSLSFLSIVYTFVASTVFTFLAFAVYTSRKNPLPQSPSRRGSSTLTSLFKGFWGGSKGDNDEGETKSVAKELFLFSLPVLGSVILGSIMTWTDTLMLGYFMTSDMVGLYNGAVPIARLLQVFLGSFAFLYLPLASQFFARNQMEELKRIYQVLTKWIFSATLPLFLIFLLFPEAVLNFLFGSSYIEAAPALRLLALGYFVHAFLGPNGNTLVVIGKPRRVMWAMLTGVILNIILNISLIPIMGITGAAIATASAYIIFNMITATILYSISKIQPFTKNYLKPVAASLIPIAIIYVLVQNFLSPLSLWMLPLLLILFLVVYGLAVLFTKSFDKEDIAMAQTLEKGLGLNLSAIKRIIIRFI